MGCLLFRGANVLKSTEYYNYYSDCWDENCPYFNMQARVNELRLRDTVCPRVGGSR